MRENTYYNKHIVKFLIFTVTYLCIYNHSRLFLILIIVIYLILNDKQVVFYITHMKL